MFKYTDGEQVVTAVLFEDNRRSAHNAFNIINDVELDSVVAPIRAIEYIMNNGRITLRNGVSVSHGEYIVKDSKGNVNRYTAHNFTKNFYEQDHQLEKDMTDTTGVNIVQINTLLDDATKKYTHHDKKLTTVVVVLASGFMLTGESFCADPKAFDESKGEEYSLDAVRDKLWELENYRHAHDVFKREVQGYQGGM